MTPEQQRRGLRRRPLTEEELRLLGEYGAWRRANGFEPTLEQEQSLYRMRDIAEEYGGPVGPLMMTPVL